MSSISLGYKRVCDAGSWRGQEAINNIDYCVAGGNYHVLYTANLNVDEGQQLTGFTVSTNFVSPSSNNGARTVTCYLYDHDPTGSSTPPGGSLAHVTLSGQVFHYYGDRLSFTFAGLNIQSGGTLYLWFYNQMSTYPADDQIYSMATYNGQNPAPAITGATFSVADLSSLDLSSASVSTGSNQVATIGNHAGRTVTVQVKYGNTLLFSGTTTTGSLTIPVDKSWFTTAGLSTVQSFSVSVSAYAAGTSTIYNDFTVVAGSDMRPSVGTPTVSIVQTGSAATYFPSTYIAGVSKAKVQASVTLPTNAGAQSVVLSYAGGSAAMTYNSTAGKWEATTAALTTTTAFTVTVTDQRGLTGSAQSASVSVVPYTAPSVTVDTAGTYRCNSGGTKTDGGAYYRAKATATWYSALSGNSLLQFDVRIQGEANGNSLSSGVQSGALGGAMSSTSSYTLVFTIKDKVSGTITKTYVLKSITRNIVVKRSGSGTYVGVGDAPTTSSGASTIELPSGGKFMVGGKNLVDIIYPVGSIYLSVNSTSPATLFGGTWERIQDRFLLAAGTSYAAGATGGEASHTLTENEMPSHKHAMNNYNNAGNEAGYGVMYGFDLVHGDQNYWNFRNPNMYTSENGGGQAHNNMPPYLAVYVWKRTA